MSAFTQRENPIGRYLSDGKQFQLLEQLVYHVGKEDSEEVIIVPEGFVTDWASIPQLLRGIIYDNIGKRAAVVHDFLYRTSGMGGLYTRKRCDEIFLEALLVLKVSSVKARIMYNGVRIGGWKPWIECFNKNNKTQHVNETNPY